MKVMFVNEKGRLRTGIILIIMWAFILIFYSVDHNHSHKIDNFIICVKDIIMKGLNSI